MVNSTAPWGRPAGVALGEESASFKWTVKERPSRNAFMVNRRYDGNLKLMSLYRRPCIHTVS